MKWLWIGIGMLALAGMVVASLTSTPSSAWDAAVKWADERISTWEGDRFPVLGGRPEVGFSPADYREACRLVEALPGDLRARIDGSGDGGGVLDDRDIEAIAPIVAAMRRGARRTRDVDRGKPRFGLCAMEREQFGWEVIPQATALKALALATRSACAHTPGEALPLLLDELSAAGDLACAGPGLLQLVGQGALGSSTRAVSDDWLRAVDDETLGALGAALAEADAALAGSARFLERELANSIRVIAESPNLTANDLCLDNPLQLWSHGFSARVLATSILAQQLEQWQDCFGALGPGASWPEYEAASASFLAATGDQVSPALALPSPDVERTRHEARAAIVQLRQAIAFHRGREIPELADPLGTGPMQVEVDGEQATFRSVGAAFVRRARRGP